MINREIDGLVLLAKHPFYHRGYDLLTVVGDDVILRVKRIEARVSIRRYRVGKRLVIILALEYNRGLKHGELRSVRVLGAILINVYVLTKGAAAVGIFSLDGDVYIFYLNKFGIFFLEILRGLKNVGAKRAVTNVLARLAEDYLHAPACLYIARKKRIRCTGELKIHLLGTVKVEPEKAAENIQYNVRHQNDSHDNRGDRTGNGAVPAHESAEP